MKDARLEQQAAPRRLVQTVGKVSTKPARPQASTGDKEGRPGEQARGDASPARHAALLTRAGSGGARQAQRVVAGLQRQFGNRHVQKVLAVARRGAGQAEVDEAAINRKRGGGHTLDEQVRPAMESAMNGDFSGVRVHTDSEADQLNRQLDARAFTSGQDLLFRQGEHQPGASSGRELLALVAQQTDGVQGKMVVGQVDDEYEREADEVARSVMERECAGVSRAARSAQAGFAQDNGRLRRQLEEEEDELLQPSSGEVLERQVAEEEEEEELI